MFEGVGVGEVLEDLVLLRGGQQALRLGGLVVVLEELLEFLAGLGGFVVYDGYFEALKVQQLEDCAGWSFSNFFFAFFLFLL